MAASARPGRCGLGIGAALAWRVRPSLHAVWVVPLATVAVRLLLDPVRYPWYWIAFETLVIASVACLLTDERVVALFAAALRRLRPAEARERLGGRGLLGRLLRGALTHSGLGAVDHGRTGEAPVVRGPLDGKDGVGDAEAPARELLLELRLRVDVARQRVLDPVVEGGENGGADPLEAVLEVERPERRLEQGRDDVAVAGEPLELVGGDLGTGRGKALAESDPTGDDGAALPGHHVGAGFCELPLGKPRKALVQLLGDREAEHAVAEKLEPLVRVDAASPPTTSA